jgi:hypothetical protein
MWRGRLIGALLVGAMSQKPEQCFKRYDGKRM